jgi:hypothetical protein
MPKEGYLLTLGHLDFNWHLDFVIWNYIFFCDHPSGVHDYLFLVS